MAQRCGGTYSTISVMRCSGVEGATDDAHVQWLRGKQMRNFMVALLVSQGTPMILAGAPPT